MLGILRARERAAIPFCFNSQGQMARKEWGGLVRSYYKPRFQLFFKTANASLKERKPWDQGAFNEELLKQVELPWQTDTTTFPVEPESDAVATCRAMQEKYGR